MRIRVGLYALLAGIIGAGGVAQSAGASEVHMMNASSIFMDYMDLSGLFNSDVLRDVVGALETTRVLAVPGAEMGIGLPALIAIGMYAWAQVRRAYHRNVLGPEPVEDDPSLELPDGPAPALGVRDRTAFALIGLGLIATPAWMGFLVYVPGHLIGWW